MLFILCVVCCYADCLSWFGLVWFGLLRVCYSMVVRFVSCSCVVFCVLFYLCCFVCYCVGALCVFGLFRFVFVNFVVLFGLVRFVVWWFVLLYSVTCCCGLVRFVLVCVLLCVLFCCVCVVCLLCVVVCG